MSDDKDRLTPFQVRPGRGHPDATSDEDKRGVVELHGFLMQPGVSANGHSFSEEVIRKAVADAQGRIKDGRMYGTVDPAGPELKMADISHQVSKLEVTEDGRVYAKVVAIDTPKGRELESMVAWADVRLAPEGIVIRRDEQGRIAEMKLTGVSIVDDLPPAEAAVETKLQVEKD